MELLRLRREVEEWRSRDLEAARRSARRVVCLGGLCSIMGQGTGVN